MDGINGPAGADDPHGLDDLLRATFHAHEDEALDVTGLAAAARTGHARRTTRRRQLTAVGAAGVLAVGGSSALALARHHTRAPDGSTAVATTTKTPKVSSSAAAEDIGSTGTPLPMAGSRAWSSHGLQVRVPEAWPENHIRCGTATASTVVIDVWISDACLINAAPFDVVEFGTTTFVDLHPEPSLHPVSVDGHPAETGTELLPDGRYAAALVVPDLDISVTVRSKNADLVSGILATARIVDADVNGCPSRLEAVEPAGPPSRPGARTTMVPGTPTSAAVCHYGQAVIGKPTFQGPAMLGSSRLITGSQLDDLTSTLNTLKPGLATWQGPAGSCPATARDGFLLRFSYASGAPVDVYLHTGDCDHLGFDNGAVTGYISPKFVADAGKYLTGSGFAIAGEAVR